MSESRPARLAGLALLFATIGWLFTIHLPGLNEGYFDAGDDHIHAAYTNETVRIWKGEGRLLGWSRLYGGGFPIFLLRPPGIYFASAAAHFITGLSVEEALKLVVVLGFCLFPLSMFIGTRLLGVGFWPSILAGLLAPLPISLWGNSLDAYHHLGVHKQLLAILLFPPTLGALWCLLREGRHGLTFTLLFPLVLLTHPYIAYCLALMPLAMLLALFTVEPGWEWRTRIPHALAWATPTLLLSLLWLVPFYFSTEIQSIDPFLGVRKSFDVVVSTTAETLRQFFLGGVLDTTRYAGTFGGGHEWGWLDNSRFFRFPILTLLCTVGGLVVMFRPRSGAYAFLGLAFLISTMLLIGPDDFPILDEVPFASQFQNIHAIFVFEWVAVALGGLGWTSLFRWGASRSRPVWKVSAVVLIGATTLGLWLTAIQERTLSSRNLIRLRSHFTENGELVLRPDLDKSWLQFKHVVDRINASPRQGHVAIRSSSPGETVIYNLLPHMVDRTVFTSGFQKVGGVYPILRGMRRDDARTNLNLQQLYNTRFVVTRANDDKGPAEWPETVSVVHANPYWELREVGPEFGPLEPLSRALVGFVGSEREWAPLMKTWITEFRRDASFLPYVVNLSGPGLNADDLADLAPFIRSVIVGAEATVPELFADVETLPYLGPAADRVKLVRKIQDRTGEPWKAGVPAPDFELTPVELNRENEIFRVDNQGPTRPLLLKRAFYRGWTLEADGVETTIFRIAPGFQMILMPPGETVLRWSYQGPNGWIWAKSAFILGLVLAFAIKLMERRLVARAAPVTREAAFAVRGSTLRFVPSALWGVLVVVMIYQTYSEAYLKRPVPIRPPGGRYAIEPYRASTLDVYWNYVVGIPREEQSFRVEISKSREFEEIVATKEETRARARFRRREFDPGEYYYRVRLEVGDRPYAWTRPIKFEVEN